MAEPSESEKEKEDLANRQKATSGEYIPKVIAALNPDLFTGPKDPMSSTDLSGLKKLLKESFWEAVNKIGDFNLKASCPEEHELIYNSSQETLEPVYFWILDQMNAQFGGDVTKYVDNFTSSPGSGHFAEMGQRATKMQEEGMKIMQTIGVLVKSLVNIIYDLREFQMRLSQYKNANSKNKDESRAGVLSLKQIWMDNVDIKRGRGSINMLAQDLQFVTLRDAFMIAESVKDVSGMDLNDRVKRMLEARIMEFVKWRELSEKELKKRYDVEKNWLKSQVASLKMYTRWAKPYFRAASQLEMKNMSSAALVSAFSTTLIQLTIMGKKKISLGQQIVDKNLPQSFKGMNIKDFYQCVLVDFLFRGIPERLGQNYAFGGRVEVRFRSYALSGDELKMLDKKMEESDVNDALSLASQMTEGSLEAMREDIEYFLKDEDEQAKDDKKDEKKGKSDDVNPFMALFGLGEKKDKKKEEKKEIKLKSDSYLDKTVRTLAQKSANESCFTVFDIYKKAHGMPSHPSPYD